MKSWRHPNVCSDRSDRRLAAGAASLRDRAAIHFVNRGIDHSCLGAPEGDASYLPGERLVQAVRSKGYRT
jgi:hypothetical protein